FVTRHLISVTSNGSSSAATSSRNLSGVNGRAGAAAHGCPFVGATGAGGAPFTKTLSCIVYSPMMFCQLQPGFRLSQDEETASLLVSVGAARRNDSHPQNGAQGARARRGLPRRSGPLPPSTVLLSTQTDGRRSGNQKPGFPLVGPRASS